MTAVLIFWWGTGQSALADRFIDYLYVEANEGDSSGGHVAIRFGNETFHFQNESPGILRIQRHEAGVFHHAYAMLGNRSIRESRIAVTDDTYNLLRGAFARLLLVQDAQLEIRDALHQDVVLLELLLRQRSDPYHTTNEITLPLSGLGYFLPDSPSQQKDSPVTVTGEIDSTSPPSPALVSLRNRIRAAYGERFIDEKISRTGAMLRKMELRAAKPAVLGISRDDLPTFEPPVSTRYRDILHAIFALRMLQAAPSLRSGTYWATEADTFKLAPYEALALKSFALQLETDLVRLADSPRTDWGLPFVLGMARLAAIEASLASGRLILLDNFPRDSQEPPRYDSALRPHLPMMEREMREVFLRKRKEFFTSKNLREADYAAMERSGNQCLDISRAVATGSALHRSPETPVPSREARLSVPQPSLPDETILAQELATAHDIEHSYQAALDSLYRYDLFRHNCVTEIFSVINHTVARLPSGPEQRGNPLAKEPGETVRRESEKRLGGYINSASGLEFIPIVSAGTVDSCYAVTSSRDLPSYRTWRLTEMKKREQALTVFLRESNTLTSTVYRPGPDDSTFLFFTDDAVALRPLFGVFNLLAGLGESLVGLLTMPAEGPGRLLSGARGLAFSLPELVFLNLRKGSMAYVEHYPEASGEDLTPFVLSTR